MGNVRYSYAFEDRESFISFFFNVAAKIIETDNLATLENRLFISLSGDAQSGKSLIALCFDFACNPERYPDGIHRNVNADVILTERNAINVYLMNRRGGVKATKEKMDNFLSVFVATNAPIIFISNLQRHDHEPVPNYEDDFNSDLLGMAVTVRREDDLHKLRGHEGGVDANVLKEILSGFRRTVDIDVRKGSSLDKILKQIKPY